MWNSITKRNHIPLMIQKFISEQKLEINQIPAGISIGECTSFSIYLNNLSNIIQNTTKEQDEKQPQTSEHIQRVYEIHRQILQYVQDVLQVFIDEFNQKFDKLYIQEDQDVHLHLLQFNGSDTFNLAMRTQNKPLLRDGIVFWKMMVTKLQDALKQYNIVILSSIYYGEICANFYENQENFFDFYLFGSAINGSIRGCKLSKALDLQLNLLLHKDFAINFTQKTSLLNYMMKKKDSSYVKINDATILSSFFIIPYSSIKDTPGFKYSITPLQLFLNEVKESSQNNPSFLEQKLKVLSENKEGFEGASLIKLVFSIQTYTNPALQETTNDSSNKKMNQTSGNKQNRISCLEGVDWEAERRSLTNKLTGIMNQLQELLVTLDIQYENVFYCAFQNLLTIRLIVKNKIDYTSRAALLVSILQQLDLKNLKKIKASSQLIFSYILFHKAIQDLTSPSGQTQISFKYSMHYLRDRKVQYISKKEGLIKYNVDMVNFYFRENPSNLLSFKTHWNPILNHTASYQNASIFLEKRSAIIAKLKEYVNQPQNSPSGYQNEFILVEGDIGTGKSSFMQLLSNDIANSMKTGQCVVFTKSLRGCLLNEIKLRFQPTQTSNLRNKQRRLFFNSFNDILIQLCLQFTHKLEEQYKQQNDSVSQNKIAQQMHLSLILSTFLTTDQLKIHPKPMAFQNQSNSGNESNVEEELIDDNLRNDLIQLSFTLLLEYLATLKVKIIIFMLDDLQYQDKWSWQVMQKISSSTQNNFKIVIIGTFRFYLPSELNEDISTYTMAEPKIIPMIRTNQQLFANNSFLNERIREITNTGNSLRFNINQINVQDQRKLIITALQNFYTIIIDEEKSNETINFILLQLFRRNQCNTPLKVLSFLYLLCKNQYILIYEMDENNKESHLDKRRISQMSQVSESGNDQSQQAAPQQQPSEANLQEQNVLKPRIGFIGINEVFQCIENNIFDSSINSPLLNASLNNSVLQNLLIESEEQMILLPKQKYFSNSLNQSHSTLNEDLIVSSSQNYLKDCKAVTFKNRSFLIWSAISLLGDQFNVNKIKYYLQNAFHISEEQIIDILSDMYLYRFISITKQEEEKDQLNQSQQQKKRSLNTSQISNNNANQQSLNNLGQTNLLDFSNISQSDKTKKLKGFIDFEWNDNMFFLLKQSLKQRLSLRMKLLLHKSYVDCMIELLSNLVEKEATSSQDFAELYTELIHQNCQYSPDKVEILLKKISPQITNLFRKRIFYFGEVYKFSSGSQGLVKCQLKLNSSTLFIYKDEEQSKSELRSSELNNGINNTNGQRDKSESKFQAQLNQIRADLMLSTARYQNIRSIWSIMKYDYTYQLVPEKQTIKIHVQYMTKHKEIGDKFTQNKAISLTFPTLSTYYTFYMGLRYSQIEPYNPDFSYEKRENYQNVTYSIKFPFLKPLPLIYDPLQKTDLLFQTPFSQLSSSAQNLFYLYRNTDYLKKHQSLNQIKKQILSLIPKGLLSLQIQANTSPRKSFNHVFSSPQKSRNASQLQTPSQSQSKIQQQMFEEQIQNYMKNSDVKVVQIPKDRSIIIEKVDKSQLNQSNQNIEPLEASRRSIDNPQQNKQFLKQATLSYEDNINHQNQQDKLFEMRILNENQPETGKFNTLEVLHHVQDDFTNQTNKILNQNQFEQTETFRKKSESYNSNLQMNQVNANNSQINQRGLHTIQEEENRNGRNSNKQSQLNNSNLSHVQRNQSMLLQQVNEQEADIFDQIESERAQYNEMVYQQQLEQSIRLNQSHNQRHNEKDLQSLPQNNSNFLKSQSSQPNTHYLQQNMLIQDPRINENNTKFTNQPNLERINDSTSMIMSEAMRQRIDSHQGPNMQRQYFDYQNSQQPPALYQLPIINQNGLINSQPYDQIQKNQQLPLQMSITSAENQYNIIPEIEEEENPFQTMNGIKTLQLQLTPIQSATKSRSTSPFQRDSSQSRNSIPPVSQYSSQKSNSIITPVKLSNQQIPAYRSDYRQFNQSGMNLIKIEDLNQQKTAPNYSQPAQGNKQNKLNEKNEYNPFDQSNNISKNNEIPRPPQNNNSQTQQQPIQQTQSQLLTNNKKQTIQSSRVNEQNLSQLKFQKDLQQRLEQVRINQEEFQKDMEESQIQNQRNLSQINLQKDLIDQLSDIPDLPIYQQRFENNNNHMIILPSDRSDSYQIEDEIQQTKRSINEQNRNQAHHINYGPLNDQVINASKNHLSNSKNNSRILSSEIMHEINQQPILQDNSTSKQALNISQTKQKIFDKPLSNNSMIINPKNNTISTNNYQQQPQQNPQSQALKHIMDSQQRQQQEYESKKSERQQLSLNNSVQRVRNSIQGKIDKAEQNFKDEKPNNISQNNEINKQQVERLQSSNPVLNRDSSNRSTISNSQRDQIKQQLNNKLSQNGQNQPVYQEQLQIQQNEFKQSPPPTQLTSNKVFINNQVQQKLVDQSKFSEIQDISQRSNRVQNVYVENYASNKQFQSSSNIPQDQSQLQKQQTQQPVYQSINTSAQMRVQKQNELFQKKKENLKKYQSQQQNQGSIPQNGSAREQRLSSNLTVENEFTDEEMINISQQIYETNAKQFNSNYISPINQSISMAAYDEDSYIGMIVKPCSSQQGDKFNLKVDDCVILKFLDDQNCEIHYEGKIGCIPKQNVKVVQRAQQFLTNLNSYNKRKQNELNDTTLNNVHKILTDIDQ